MTDRLGPSEWTVPEARGLAAQLRHVATTADEYDGLELFKALCDYLDQLYGGRGFDKLLPAQDRAAMAVLIKTIRGSAATGSVLLDEDGVPVQLDAADAAGGYDTLLRLDQPVNAAVTLSHGRALAVALAGSSGWQGELGRALHGLYGYLDELYGGPGAFTELLTTDERAQIARGPG